MNLKSTTKHPWTPVGADNVSCYFIQHTFLHCAYCCDLWVSCRGLGRWLLSVTRSRSAALLGQKPMCAGWCALLWRWNGKMLPGNSSACLTKNFHASGCRRWSISGIRHICHVATTRSATVRSSVMTPMYRGCQEKVLSPYPYPSSPAWLYMRLYQGLSRASNQQLQGEGNLQSHFTFIALHCQSFICWVIWPIFHPLQSSLMCQNLPPCTFLIQKSSWYWLYYRTSEFYHGWNDYQHLFSLLSKQSVKSNYWQIKKVELTAAEIQKDHTVS